MKNPHTNPEAPKYRDSFIYISNVTVQGTRHLVEGTLEPIVGSLFHIVDGVRECHSPNAYNGNDESAE